MNTFWRNDVADLTKEESDLLEALWAAHYRSCFRNNASSMAVAIAADSSGDLAKAIVAGISTMGGRHAPLEETVQFLASEYSVTRVADMLKRGQKIPGWGGNFQKDQPDPLWENVDQLIEKFQPMMHQKLKAITAQLHQHGKELWPNPSAYTACVAIALGLSAQLAPFLFICGRLTGWTEIAMRNFEPRKAD